MLAAGIRFGGYEILRDVGDVRFEIDGGTPDIWVRQVGGGEPVRLTNDATVESDLVYAPDGETIYFTKAEGPARSIWRIGALGGQPRKVVNNALAASPSPDGRRLAWFEPEAKPILSYSLVVGASDGGSKRTLVENVLVVVVLGRAAWSPDGRSLAYSSGALFSPRNLFVVNLDDGRTRQVTHLTHGTEAISTQAWLADSRRVVVSYTPPDHLFVNDLSVVDIETGKLDRLTANLTDSFNAPSVSADGTRGPRDLQPAATRALEGAVRAGSRGKRPRGDPPGRLVAGSDVDLRHARRPHAPVQQRARRQPESVDDAARREREAATDYDHRRRRGHALVAFARWHAGRVRIQRHR